MTVFRHILWGYELTYPEHWTHQSVQDAESFSMDNPDGLDASQLLVRGEWNWERQPIEPLWNRHIGMMAGMIGAKQVGSARLWTGILMHDFRVLHFMVTHPKEVREQFEPAATNVISSLRFLNRILGIKSSREGIPLPPAYKAVDPTSILTDISDPANWHAYSGQSGIGALQAFFLREVPIHNWEMEEYVPFPSSSELGFARFQLRRRDLKITLGIMPYDLSGSGTITSSSPANIVIKVA